MSANLDSPEKNPVFKDDDDFSLLSLLEIKEISSEENIKFLKESMAYKEWVFIRSGENIVGAFLNNTLIGVCGISTKHNCSKPISTYVVKEFRNKGVGTILLRECFFRFGIKSQVWTLSTKDCMGCYNRMGFVIQNHYEKHDTYYMKGWRSYIFNQPLTSDRVSCDIKVFNQQMGYIKKNIKEKNEEVY